MEASLPPALPELPEPPGDADLPVTDGEKAAPTPRVQALDVLTKREPVEVTEAYKEWAMCAAVPPPTLHVGEYGVGMPVVVIKPAMRVVDVGVMTMCTEAHPWVQVHMPVKTGADAVVLSHVQHPSYPQLLHVVRLQRTPHAQNVMIVPPEAMGPASWTGQFVVVADASSRCDADPAVREMTTVVGDRWAGEHELRQGRSARVVACLKHSGKQLCLLRFEPPGLVDAQFCVVPATSVVDASTYQSTPGRLQLTGAANNTVTDLSAAAPREATYYGDKGHQVVKPMRGQMQPHTQQLHVLKYAQDPDVGHVGSAYGHGAVPPPREMTREEMNATKMLRGPQW
eukprot:TRINITY_DN25123_c0_g1_i1.p1 TRINITY_DN25123_c0_g1~~TRINITY_DN25123_c0_g1_i1.p1  ORF type:complete len:341 (+),score=61.83 TRINITY_DN25123_c0_g1_i1:43-1065(+)